MVRKKAKKTINTKALIFIGIAVVGLILAILGLCTPWITKSSGNLAEGLFATFFDDVQKACETFKIEIYSIGIVRTFGIIAFVLAIIATALIVLKTLGIFELKGLIKLIVAVAVVVVAVLLLVFAINYVTSLNDVIDKIPSFLGVDFYSMGIASFLLPIGTATTGVAYLLNK